MRGSSSGSLTHIVQMFTPRISLKQRVSNMMGQEPTPKEKDARKRHWLIDSMAFGLVMNGLIIMNSIQMGLCIETKGDGMDWGETGETACQIADYCFLGAFTVEFSIKIGVLCGAYFRSGWNVFDLLVLLAGFLDLAIKQWINLQSLRILRMFKLLRVARTFPDLWVIVEGFIVSIRPIFWVIAILSVLLYVFSLVCVNTIGSQGEDVYPGYTTSVDRILESESFKEFNNFIYFGTIPRSMFTLFNVVIGTEWPEIGRALWEREQQRLMVGVFGLFTLLSTFGLNNVLIGVIVDNTKAAQERLRREDEALVRLRKDKVVETLIDFVEQINQLEGEDPAASQLPRAEEDPAASRLPRAAEGETVTLKLWEDYIATHRSEVSAVIGAFDLPPQFSGREMFQLFSLHGCDRMDKLDLVVQAHRLIHGSRFQKECMLVSSMNGLRQDMSRMRQEVDRLSAGQANLLAGQADLTRKIRAWRGGEVASDGAPAPSGQEAGSADRLSRTQGRI